MADCSRTPHTHLLLCLSFLRDYLVSTPLVKLRSAADVSNCAVQHPDSGTLLPCQHKLLVTDLQAPGCLLPVQDAFKVCAVGHTCLSESFVFEFHGQVSIQCSEIGFARPRGLKLLFLLSLTCRRHCGDHGIKMREIYIRGSEQL